MVAGKGIRGQDREREVGGLGKGYRSARKQAKNVKDCNWGVCIHPSSPVSALGRQSAPQHLPAAVKYGPV